MKWTKKDLIKIYKDAKNNVISYPELQDIKEPLILAINNLDATIIPYLGNLIFNLFILFKENKLDCFDLNFINFAKTNIDYAYFPIVLYGVTYDKTRVTDNILDNEILFLNIESLFQGLYDILEVKPENIKYLEKSNLSLSHIITYYINEKINIFNNENLSLENKLVLISILNHIASIFYINQDEYQNNYLIIEECMKTIKDNFALFRSFFIQNNMYDTPSFIGSISSGGLQQELYIIGEILNDTYNKKMIVKKRQNY